MAAGSKKVVVAALFGNAAVAVTKFVAAGMTGSSAMFSEAVHSVVDTGNQALLLHGLRRADRAADDSHPFGYGRELYFWAFVVAILIFAVGAGVSLYEGVDKILHPHELTNVYINYIVLGLAIAFESVAWWVAWKEFRVRKGRRTILQAVRSSKDPAVFTVLFEDTAAMAGLLIALVGILIGQATGALWVDGAASVLIGMILALTAALLAYECKGLLIGEGARSELTAAVRRHASSRPGVKTVNELLTMHMGPQDVLLCLSVDFHDRLSSADVEAEVSQLEHRIKQQFPEVTRVFVEAQNMRRHRAAAT